MEHETVNPCPFCGGFPMVHDYDNHMGRRWRTFYYIECANCNAKSGVYAKEQEAIEAWNNRTQ